MSDEATPPLNPLPPGFDVTQDITPTIERFHLPSSDASADNEQRISMTLLTPTVSQVDSDSFWPIHRANVSREALFGIGVPLEVFQRELVATTEQMLPPTIRGILGYYGTECSFERAALPKQWRTLQLLERLGTGAYGTVMSACASVVDPATGQPRVYNFVMKLQEMTPKQDPEFTRREALNVYDFGAPMGYKLYGYFEVPAVYVDLRRRTRFACMATNRLQMSLRDYILHVGFDQYDREKPMVQSQMKDQMAYIWLHSGGALLYDRHLGNWMIDATKARAPKVTMIDMDPKMMVPFPLDKKYEETREQAQPERYRELIDVMMNPEKRKRLKALKHEAQVDGALYRVPQDVRAEIERVVGKMEEMADPLAQL